jgi:hypothetical protein
MSNFCFSKSLKFICAFFLLIIANLQGAQSTFDGEYKIAIRQDLYFGRVHAPSILTDGKWEATHFEFFENGLYGVYETTWQYEYDAKLMAKHGGMSGDVNILYLEEDQFTLVPREGRAITLQSLWVDTQRDYSDFPENPRIVSITENTSDKKAKKKSYEYVIELSDGTRWLKTFKTTPWDDQWALDSQIAIIGNAAHPCFVNTDLVKNNDYSVVKIGQFLTDLKKM